MAASVLFLSGGEAATPGPPRKPSEAGCVGRGGTAQRVSFAACGEARDAELVPTRGGGEREGKEWVIDGSEIAWSLVTLSLFKEMLI